MLCSAATPRLRPENAPEPSTQSKTRAWRAWSPRHACLKSSSVDVYAAGFQAALAQHRHHCLPLSGRLHRPSPYPRDRKTLPKSSARYRKRRWLASSRQGTNPALQRKQQNHPATRPDSLLSSSSLRHQPQPSPVVRPLPAPSPARRLRTGVLPGGAAAATPITGVPSS